MNAIFKFVMSMLAKKSGKTGITTIPKASGLNVELTAKQIQKTLENMGVDISKIKSPKEVQKYLNIHGSWMDQQLKQKAKALGLTDPKKNIFMQKKDLPEWTEGWRPTVIQGGKGKDTVRDITNRLEESTKKIEDILREEKKLKDWKPTSEAFLKQKYEGLNKKTIERIKRRRYEAALKAEREKMAKDSEYIPEILDPEDFAHGGRASSGLNYLLGEDDQNVRVPVNQGGRIAFGLGGFNAARRAFLKVLGAGAATAGAAKSGLFSLLKGTSKKQVVESLTHIPIENAAGMPAWFKPLVNKVIKEGDDVTKKFATADREIVHQVSLEGKLGKDALGVEDIRVTQDLNTGNVRVQYNTPNSMGEYGVDLNYQAAEIVDDASIKAGKEIKTKPEFSAVEAEPRVVNRDGDMEWDGENMVNVVDDLLTDTTKLETYATGKNPTIKKLLKSEKKQKKVKQLNEDTVEQANYIEDKYGPGPEPSDDLIKGIDYASGGRVPLAGGKGVMSLIQMLNKKFGKGTAKRASELKRPESALTREMFQNFNKELKKADKDRVAQLGKFTKSEVLIQMLENTLKGSKDSWTKINLPNFIKELKAKPELANDPQVWNFFTAKLPKNQRLVVHSDDTVDFWRQSEFGPHNIETTNKFMQKHPNLSRDEAVRIQNMEPEDQILEMKRLETIADRGRTKQAYGGVAGMLGE